MSPEQPIPKNSLKQIDLTKKEFVANGKTYYIESSISFERFLWYQKLEIECGYQVGFYGLFENIKKIYELCNGMKFADIAVLCHNVMNGIKMVDNRKIPFLQMCALFINTADEDRSIISDDIVDRKIADWEAEKLDILPFFQLGASSIKNFSTVYKELTQAISENEETVSERVD